MYGFPIPCNILINKLQWVKRVCFCLIIKPNKEANEMETRIKTTAINYTFHIYKFTLLHRFGFFLVHACAFRGNSNEMNGKKVKKSQMNNSNTAQRIQHSKVRKMRTQRVFLPFNPETDKNVLIFDFVQMHFEWCAKCEALKPSTNTPNVFFLHFENLHEIGPMVRSRDIHWIAHIHTRNTNKWIQMLFCRVTWMQPKLTNNIASFSLETTKKTKNN